MTTKHTPGPWQWLDSGLWGEHDFIYTDPKNAEFAANAALIAAAPELLEALEAWLPCIKELIGVAKKYGKWVSQGTAEDALESTLIVIKKARGYK